MTTTALFVDLPNFYGNLLRSGIDEPRVLRDYFLDWLDFDRLAFRLAGELSSVWLFYSGHRLGPSDNRIDGTYLQSYVARINALRGITAWDVNIPGEQREPASYLCEKCGHSGVGQWESEKGIDASLTVHLFDTADAWDHAYLLSGDADFVPVVASLRRRGKIVSGAGFSDASSALIRECFDYLDFCDFLREDVAMYLLFKPNGIVVRWLTDDVWYLPHCEQPEVRLVVELLAPDAFGDLSGSRLGIGDKGASKWVRAINLYADGPVDLASRRKLVQEFGARFPEHLKCNDDRCTQLLVSPLGWQAVERRLGTVYQLPGATRGSERNRLFVQYRYTGNATKAEAVLL